MMHSIFIDLIHLHCSFFYTVIFGSTPYINFVLISEVIKLTENFASSTVVFKISF